MEKKITLAQHTRAREIVRKYEAQNKVKPRKLTMDDIDDFGNTLSIPYLTDKLIDEGFATALYQELANDYTLEWLSLDDMGYIEMAFRDSRGYSKEERPDSFPEDLLRIANELLGYE